ncbi:rod shape-determining protein MreD [Candidatus Oleimmundimicrobium sp.]|uniref:rod shape-determining protein MreD n=1 Tax=Candidatus Oleimmundimicrobium sp. TaxID=3060597 RepID=UPI002718BE4B|nr:rod shape-determining protein MreD [Candidatus Oleimmundimicrobium sp.]MDO8886140.1 rod shape-determining protein MreD [Candidatus Oleimmundimicrobium sp.]
MQSFLTLFLVLFIVFLSQTTIVPYFEIGGVQPDLVLIVITICALIEGPVWGSLAGFMGGLLQDLVTIRNMGLGALSKTIVGYLAGLAKKNVVGENLFLPVIVVFLTSLSAQIIYVLFSFLIGDIIVLRQIFFRVIIPSAIYDSLLALPIYLLLLKILTRKKERLLFEREATFYEGKNLR